MRNRTDAAPMCMYSVEDGLVGKWHPAHRKALAAGGAGLVIVEMTAVSPKVRITWNDSGLWNEEQVAALNPIAAVIKAAGSVPAIQLGYAGRKTSTNGSWEGDNQTADDAPNGWPVIGPSPSPSATTRFERCPSR